MSRVRDVISAAESRTAPPEWRAATPDMAGLWSRFADFLAQEPAVRVYGVNTLPGHQMAAETALSSSQINRAILESHTAGWGEPFDGREVAYLTAAKISALTVGGVPVRPETFIALIDGLEGEAIGRAQIPRHASYSCGDVVPAAHWVRTIFADDDAVQQLGPGEVMALINGNFVSIGAAMSLLLPLARTFASALRNEAELIDIVDAPREMIAVSFHGCSTAAQRSLELLADAAGDSDPPLWEQLPVSIRALPQLASLRVEALAHLVDVLDKAAGRPSGNPLFDAGKAATVSQASFLCLDVSMALDRLISTLLAAMWNLTERVKYLVARANDAIGDNPVGMIQLPKLIQTELENARRRHGTRAFASGGATSSGIEDFWGFTLPLSNDLKALNERYRDLIAIERHLLGLFGSAGNLVPLASWTARGFVIDHAAWKEVDEGWFAEMLASIGL